MAGTVHGWREPAPRVVVSPIRVQPWYSRVRKFPADQKHASYDRAQVERHATGEGSFAVGRPDPFSTPSLLDAKCSPKRDDEDQRKEQPHGVAACEDDTKEREELLHRFSRGEETQSAGSTPPDR